MFTLTMILGVLAALAAVLGASTISVPGVHYPSNNCAKRRTNRTGGTVSRGEVVAVDLGRTASESDSKDKAKNHVTTIAAGHLQNGLIVVATQDVADDEEGLFAESDGEPIEVMAMIDGATTAGGRLAVGAGNKHLATITTAGRWHAIALETRSDPGTPTLGPVLLFSQGQYSPADA